jgi:hypothetical protein
LRAIVKKEISRGNPSAEVWGSIKRKCRASPIDKGAPNCRNKGFERPVVE